MEEQVFLNFLLFGRRVSSIINNIDLFVGPVVFFLLFLITLKIYNKKYSRKPYGKYYIISFVVKMIGTVVMAFLYQYFFNGGDTFNYFNGANVMFTNLLENTPMGLEMYLKTPDNYSDVTKMLVNRSSKGFYSFDPETTMYRIGGWLSLITFKSYIGISMIISYYAFLAYWKLYLVFVDLYPKFYNAFAFGVLLIPTACLYGTGLMKDPIVTAALCYLTYDIYIFVFKKERRFISLIRVPISLYLLFIIKAYIVALFIPPLFFWIFMSKLKKIKSPVIRKLSWPVTFVLIGVISVGGSNFLASKVSNRYSLANALESSVTIANWIAYKTEKSGGSGYSLGKLEPTLKSVLGTVPAAVNVTFFRPYFWDVKGPAYYPIVLESLFTMLFTIYVFLKVGLLNAFRRIFENPTVFFCFSYAIIFGFFVGFISQNFGALVRYKLPCMPFYYSGLIILLSYSKRRLKFSKLSF